MVVVNDVVVDVGVEEVVAVAEDVRRRRGEPQSDRGAVHPNVARRHRRPTDVRVVRSGYPPHDPGGSVLPPRNPGPTRAGDPDPAPVVKHHPAERIVADPDPVALGGLRPVTIGDVGSEIATDCLFVRHPDNAVRRIVYPASMRVERGAEVGQRARISVDILVAGRGFRRCRRRRFGRLRGRGWRPHVAVLPLLCASGRARENGGNRQGCQNPVQHPPGHHRGNHALGVSHRQPTCPIESALPHIGLRAAQVEQKRHEISGPVAAALAAWSPHVTRQLVSTLVRCNPFTPQPGHALKSRRCSVLKPP